MPAATAECSGVALQISMHEFPQADVNAAASAHLGVQGALEHATPAMQRTLQGGVLKESEQQVLQEPSPHICRPAPLVGRNAAGCSQALGPSLLLATCTSACRCEQAHASTHSRALSVASTAAAVHQASASQPACQAPSHPACPPTFRALALSIAANQLASGWGTPRRRLHNCCCPSENASIGPKSVETGPKPALITPCLGGR